MSSRRIKMMVSFDLPEHATRRDAVNYVEDAVSSMHGCYRPDNWDGAGGEGDPMFYLDGDTVKVTDMGERLS